ncbi:hypothetical protein [Bacillus wiedmannii]|uniref:Uncharacterized protein n=1 Tax=Bacillus wiedmannii TaxID=1890302 RepID=A0A2A8BSP4_9BACI|nr:hypothetical protein [Bacillus wiedmannii]PEM57609.1 hypothetical protein CN611_07290 [Bacillus wiedmannii]
MAKKKRYLQKEVKTVEVYRKPTLQEAWDIVSDHLAHEFRKGEITWFVDTVGVKGYEHGRVVLNSGGSYFKVLAVSTKNYSEDM